MAEVTYRAATAADAGALAAVARTALLDALAVSGPVPGQAVLSAGRGWERAAGVVAGSACVLASARRRVIGGCHGRWRPGRGDGPPALVIEGLAVDPMYQDAGVGSALFLLLLARFDTTAGLCLRAAVPTASQAGHAFFERFEGARRYRRASRVLPPPTLDLWFEWPSLDGFQRRLDAALDRRLRAAGAFPFTGSREDP
ncbi:MAG: GNAT family N-acetyltransferase [Pseudomonadota bacterium]|nr:GNAT family N-acetyltransferase [Pseudomonadota bacterium]